MQMQTTASAGSEEEQGWAGISNYSTVHVCFYLLVPPCTVFDMDLSRAKPGGSGSSAVVFQWLTRENWTHMLATVQLTAQDPYPAKGNINEGGFDAHADADSSRFYQMIHGCFQLI
jgi:hypothetical protein